MKADLKGIVEGVYLCNQSKSLASEQVNSLEITLEGVVGDQHYGSVKPSDGRTPFYPRGTIIRNSRQVSLVSVEELEEISRLMNIPEIKPEWLGANLLVRGIPRFTFVPPGSRLFFPGGAVLMVQGENLPCSGPARIIQQHYPEIEGLADAFPRLGMHLRGIVAWVEHPGRINPQESIEVQLRIQQAYSG